MRRKAAADRIFASASNSKDRAAEDRPYIMNTQAYDSQTDHQVVTSPRRRRELERIAEIKGPTPTSFEHDTNTSILNQQKYSRQAATHDQRNSPLRKVLDSIPNELIDNLISKVTPMNHIQPPKINPKMVKNQMIGYGKQKRASMKSTDNAVNNHVHDSATPSSLAHRTGITHHANCQSEFQKRQ